MAIIQKYKEKIYRTLLFVLYRIYEHFYKIDDTLVAFSSDVDYSDNSRVLYEYLLNNHPKYHFVWFLRKTGVYAKKPKTEFVRLFCSIKSVKRLATAKYIFYTHPLGNKFCPRKEQIVVNLWHGVPFKGVKGDYVPSKPKFNYLMCLGDNNISTTAKFIGCDEEYVRPWGFPRNDLLFSARDEGKNNPFVPSDFNGKVIIWMPTFRKSVAKHLSEDLCDSDTGLPLLTTETALSELNEYLSNVNLIIIVKVHHLQAQKDAFKHNFSNVLFLQDKDIISRGYQLYEIVAKSDALLTDYSSIHADYLVMNKPIGFILDDLKEYEKSRGSFMYDPITDVLGGSHLYSINDLKKFLNEVAAGIDSTSELRRKVIKDMIKYPDGNSCKRIVENLEM